MRVVHLVQMLPFCCDIVGLHSLCDREQNIGENFRCVLASKCSTSKKPNSNSRIAHFFRNTCHFLISENTWLNDVDTQDTHDFVCKGTNCFEGWVYINANPRVWADIVYRHLRNPSQECRMPTSPRLPFLTRGKNTAILVMNCWHEHHTQSVYNILHVQFSMPHSSIFSSCPSLQFAIVRTRKGNASDS